MAYGVSRGALMLDFDANSMRQLQRDLRRVDKDTANTLRREMRSAGNLVRDGLRESAVDALGDLSNKTGLDEGRAAKYGIKTKVHRSGVYVRWEATKGSRGFTQRRQTNDGYIRHPVYGNKGVWAVNNYPKARGWWDRAEETHLEEAGHRIINALDDALRSMAALTS